MTTFKNHGQKIKKGNNDKKYFKVISYNYRLISKKKSSETLKSCVLIPFGFSKHPFMLAYPDDFQNYFTF